MCWRYRLVCSGGEFQVQGLANQSTFRLGEGPLGPFSSSLEGTRAMLKSYLAMIASGEIDGFPPVDAYLAHRFRVDVTRALFSNDTPAEQFFLKHADDKGDHILVNESFDIVGIIDWEWAGTTSKAKAFASPCMMWPVARFYDGENGLAAHELRLADIFRERGRDDLAECVIAGRKVQRFFSALGPDVSGIDEKTFRDLFWDKVWHGVEGGHDLRGVCIVTAPWLQLHTLTPSGPMSRGGGLRRAFDAGDAGWEEWNREALEKWKDDQLLLGLLKGAGEHKRGL